MEKFDKGLLLRKIKRYNPASLTTSTSWNPPERRITFVPFYFYSSFSNTLLTSAPDKAARVSALTPEVKSREFQFTHYNLRVVLRLRGSRGTPLARQRRATMQGGRGIDIYRGLACSSFFGKYGTTDFNVSRSKLRETLTRKGTFISIFLSRMNGEATEWIGMGSRWLEMNYRWINTDARWSNIQRILLLIFAS